MSRENWASAPSQHAGAYRHLNLRSFRANPAAKLHTTRDAIAMMPLTAGLIDRAPKLMENYLGEIPHKLKITKYWTGNTSLMPPYMFRSFSCDDLFLRLLPK